MTTTRHPEATTEMTGRELRQFLGAVLPHAGIDDTLPVLTVVILDASGGMLHALASDRYTLALARHPLPETASSPLTGAVAAAALQAIVRQIKARARVRLTLTTEGLSIDQLSDPQISYHLPNRPAFAPLLHWRPWLAEQLQQKPELVVTAARAVALNPAFLARFRTASRDGLPLKMRPMGRCMVITCGNHFLGLAMPMGRSTDHAASPDPLTDWLTTPPPAQRVA
ncbi:hypothetical protein ACFFMN_15840 [Planobispora siamensis]|uniref:Uncharacterized protein n=1 Tax=Planobispora siamensis TaxID=936338 RepID=A0A8J3SKD9_9ACTN|nr:hypothetical protein [Planobispora siamensis]GIH93909.1 hypothetical protein Psi01_45390 [Planobispora siamensis]